MDFNFMNDDVVRYVMGSCPHWFPFNYTDTIDESTQGHQNSPQYRISGGHGYGLPLGQENMV